MAKTNQKHTKCIKRKSVAHALDYSRVDQVDEISGDEQLSLVWCLKHKEYEWHWVERN
jgi:hypothetical protein